jgi:hypothetical protein
MMKSFLRDQAAKKTASSGMGQSTGNEWEISSAGVSSLEWALHLRSIRTWLGHFFSAVWADWVSSGLDFREGMDHETL